MGNDAPGPTDRALAVLTERLVRHRLNRNLTQEELARAAGISRRTLARLEAGKPTQLDSFLRVLFALGLGEGLEHLVPAVPASPIQQPEHAGEVRRRARGRRGKPKPTPREPWTWGDES